MSIEISMCMAVWNTSHLLRRSVQTYLKQDLDPERWELIVIDDNSQDDVEEALKPLVGKINLQHRRLEHSFGMRGNTVSLNTAFGMAKGSILGETTPECLLPPHAVRSLLEPHGTHPRCFVALKTYNLTMGQQLAIDQVDWPSNILNISKLPEWDGKWCQNNVANTNFVTHQICSIRKVVFFEIMNGLGFPLFGGYGEEDPHYELMRYQKGVQGITLPVSCMAVHQWHAPFVYWMAKGRAPNLNKHKHSMSNYLGDRSGYIPDGGTCVTWDNGSHEQMSKEEIAGWLNLDAAVIGSGVPEQIVHGGNEVRVKA